MTTNATGSVGTGQNPEHQPRASAESGHAFLAAVVEELEALMRNIAPSYGERE